MTNGNEMSILSGLAKFSRAFGSRLSDTLTDPLVRKSPSNEDHWCKKINNKRLILETARGYLGRPRQLMPSETLPIPISLQVLNTRRLADPSKTHLTDYADRWLDHALAHETLGGASILALRPFVARIPAVFTAAESRDLLATIDNFDAPSEIAVCGLLTKFIRHGQTHQFRAPLGHSPAMRRANLKMAEVAGFGNEHGECLTLNHYDKGGFFNAHYDFLPDVDRIATLIVCLQGAEMGGETHFISPNLKIKLRVGEGLYFVYGNAAGDVDLASLHAGMPVLQGNKAFAQRFFHINPWPTWIPDVTRAYGA